MSYKKKLDHFIEMYGKKGLILLGLYPIIIVPMTFYSLLRSLGNIIFSLTKQPWNALTANTQHAALNNYFYKVQDLNLRRFGRYGESTYVAGGNDFSLKNWFHVMPVALNIQAKIGVVAMLFIAMIIWISSWFFVMEPSPQNYAIILLAISSTYFFANFIDGQNYNVLAWMLLPLLFYALFSNDYIIYALLLFIVSFLSFTAVFILSIISTIFALYWWDPYILIAITPAAIKAGIPLCVAVWRGTLKKMGGAIGIHNQVKYNRTDKKTSTLVITITLVIFLSFFSTVYYIFYGIDDFLILQLIILALSFVNWFVARFADPQTFYILFLTVFTFSLIDKDWNIFMLMCFIIAINPIYHMIGYKPLKNPVYPPIRKPINTKKFLNNIKQFTDPIAPKSRVLFLFKNPNNLYRNIFDSYRVFVEPFLYQFQKDEITIFPDWFYLYEYNKITDTDLIWWNDDISELNKSTDLFKADYILTYKALLEKEDIPFLEETKRVFIPETNTDFILYKVKK